MPKWSKITLGIFIAIAAFGLIIITAHFFTHYGEEERIERLEAMEREKEEEDYEEEECEEENPIDTYSVYWDGYEDGYNDGYYIARKELGLEP